jgi:hypothetical protein
LTPIEEASGPLSFDVHRFAREELMQISNYRSTSSDDLLDCRMAMMGLDLSAVEGYDGAMFEVTPARGRGRYPRPPASDGTLPQPITSAADLASGLSSNVTLGCLRF